MKRIILLIMSFVLVGALVGYKPVLAQSFLGDTFNQLDAAGGQNGAGYASPQDPRLVVAQIIKYALALIGTVVFVLMVYAGYTWMMAGGNDEEVSKAKTIIRNSVFGLIVILSAYGLTILVTNLAVGRSAGSGLNRGSTLDSAVQNQSWLPDWVRGR